MRRCIQLAQNGLCNAAPNPMVGAVIVCDGKIIGEGYHVRCGEAHAEVNAIRSVKDPSLLKRSTIYVSLEPCAQRKGSDDYRKWPQQGPCPLSCGGRTCDADVDNQRAADARKGNHRLRRCRYGRAESRYIPLFQRHRGRSSRPGVFAEIRTIHFR